MDSKDADDADGGQDDDEDQDRLYLDRILLWPSLQRRYVFYVFTLRLYPPFRKFFLR